MELNTGLQVMWDQQAPILQPSALMKGPTKLIDSIRR